MANPIASTSSSPELQGAGDIVFDDDTIPSEIVEQYDDYDSDGSKSPPRCEVSFGRPLEEQDEVVTINAACASGSEPFIVTENMDELTAQVLKNGSSAHDIPSGDEKKDEDDEKENKSVDEKSESTEEKTESVEETTESVDENTESMEDKTESVEEEGATTEEEDGENEDDEERGEFQEEKVDEEETDEGHEENVVDEKKVQGEEEDEWMYILGHEHLKKKVLIPGEGLDSRPVMGSQVAIFCKTYLTNGTFLVEEELTVIVGDGDVIQALDLTLPLTQLGETCLLYTDAKYAYGQLGCEPNIPHNANLNLEVSILSVQDEPVYSTLPLTERVFLGDQKRNRGNFWYNRDELSFAITCYRKALKILEDGPVVEASQEELRHLQELQLKCYNNLGAAQLKLRAFEAARMSFDAVLETEPDNVKAWFRKAKCFSSQGETEKAIECLEKAYKLDKNNKTIELELDRLRRYFKLQSERSRQMYERMMGFRASRSPGKEDSPGSSSWKKVAGGVAVLAAVVSIAMATYRYW